MSGKKIHGHAAGGKLSPTYRSWAAMVRRCTNPNNVAWKDYGGRGISFVKRWKCFVDFLEDMGPRPEGMTLDRIKPNENYSKSNCRWATRSTQSQNQRQRSDATSKYRGVSKSGNGWVAYIHRGNKQIYVGYFKHEVAAAKALKEASV